MITVEDFDRIIDVTKGYGGTTGIVGVSFGGLRNCFYIPLSPTRRIFRGEVNTNNLRLETTSDYTYSVEIRDNYRSDVRATPIYVKQSVTFNTQVWDLPFGQISTGKPQAIPLKSSFIFKVFDCKPEVTSLTEKNSMSNPTWNCHMCGNGGGSVIGLNQNIPQSKIDELIKLDLISSKEDVISQDEIVIKEEEKTEEFVEKDLITSKEPVTIQDEIIINEAEKQIKLIKPAVCNETYPCEGILKSVSPIPDLETGKLEGDFNEKDFTGQPSTLEKEVKINKKDQQKALIVIGTGVTIALLVGISLYVMSKRKNKNAK